MKTTIQVFTYDKILNYTGSLLCKEVWDTQDCNVLKKRALRLTKKYSAHLAVVTLGSYTYCRRVEGECTDKKWTKLFGPQRFSYSGKPYIPEV